MNAQQAYNSQQAYSEWKSAIQMRESLEADYLAALRSRDWPRMFEIRHYWLTEARDYCTETLKLYRQARRAAKTQGVIPPATQRQGSAH